MTAGLITCEVRHTDVMHRDGGISDNYPFLLGHDATGTARPSKSRKAP